MRSGNQVRIELSNAINKQLNDLKRVQPKIRTESQLAKLIGCSAASLSNYKNGYRVPDQKFLERFSQICAAGNIRGTGRKAQLELNQEQLQRAEDIKMELIASCEYQESESSLVHRLKRGISLKVSSVDYGPITGHSPGDFFEQVCGRFFDLCGVTVEKVEPRRSLRMGKGNADILFGVFEAPDRILRGLRYWRMPFRIGLGAVCMKSDRADIAKIARVLTRPEERTLQRIQPIVVDGELGMIHCMTRLGFKLNEIVRVDSGNVEALRNELKKQSKNALAIPVVCTDEIKVLRVLASLAQDEDGQTGQSVFPLNSKSNTRDEIIRRGLPQYYCSMAIQRGDTAFESFVEEAWSQFLSTETESIATSLFDTAKALFGEVLSTAVYFDQTDAGDTEDKKARSCEAALQWTLFSVSLDRWSIGAYGVDSSWKVILNRAREKFQEYLAEQSQRSIISRVVKHMCVYQGRSTNRGIMKACQDVFDIDPVPSPINNNTSFNSVSSREHLVVESLVRGVVCHLSGRPVEVVVGVYDDSSREWENFKPAAEKRFKSFMAVLRSEYERSDLEAATEEMDKLTEHLGSEKSDFGGNLGRILYAIRVADGQQRLIGSACLTGLNTAKAELLYLWVEPRFRGNQVGTELIQTAIGETRYWPAPRVLTARMDLKISATAGSVFVTNGFTKKEDPGTKSKRPLAEFELELLEKYNNADRKS